MYPNPATGAGETALRVRALEAGCDLLGLFAVLRGDDFPWLLDSSLQGQHSGRFSLAGSDPYLVLRAFGRQVEIESRRAVRPEIPPGRRNLECDPLELVRSLMPPPPPVDDAASLPFIGGAVGYFGYELGALFEPVTHRGRDELGLPDLTLLFVDRLLVVDHELGRAFAVGLGFGDSHSEAVARADRAADALCDRIRAVPELSRRAAFDRDDLAVEPLTRSRLLGTGLPPDLRADFDESSYAKVVRILLDEIEAGNVYQANLTQRMEIPYAGDSWRLYRFLRRMSPTPFCAYLDLPEAAILSSSPERFLRLDADGRVESRPIKGTRPRGASAREDAALERELAESAKDRAENLMIVDLVRNDLGRVCEPGSVEVRDLMTIEAYATLFQMVSTVTGRLRSGCDVMDLLRATFPPGSMTGAPKIAAMRLLDRLEPVRRGVYSGAIGYLDLRGGADLSVVIRTLLVKSGRASFHVGGGIVADSDPAAEYRETLDKARALLAAVALARDAQPEEHKGER